MLRCPTGSRARAVHAGRARACSSSVHLGVLSNSVGLWMWSRTTCGDTARRGMGQLLSILLVPGSATAAHARAAARHPPAAHPPPRAGATTTAPALPPSPHLKHVLQLARKRQLEVVVAGAAQLGGAGALRAAAQAQ